MSFWHHQCNQQSASDQLGWHNCEAARSKRSFHHRNETSIPGQLNHLRMMQSAILGNVKCNIGALSEAGGNCYVQQSIKRAHKLTINIMQDSEAPCKIFEVHLRPLHGAVQSLLPPSASHRQTLSNSTSKLYCQSFHICPISFSAGSCTRVTPLSIHDNMQSLWAHSLWAHRLSTWSHMVLRWMLLLRL